MSDNEQKNKKCDSLADVVDAAHVSGPTTEKSSAVGNAAAMREALLKAKKAICHHAEYVCQSLAWENSTQQSNCGDVLCAHRDLCEAKTAIDAALSLPPRNCDVMSVESAKKVWLEKEIMPRIDGDLPLGNEIPFDDWFVSQYYQGECDGSK